MSDRSVPMPDSYHPPSTEQVEALLERHALRPPSPTVVWAPLVAIGLLLVMTMMLEGVWGAVLPWLGLAALFGYLVVRVRRAKGIDRRVAHAQELGTLRHYRKALAAGWRLLPRVEAMPTQYLRTLTLMGHCLDELDAPEAAIVCFDRLIELLPEEHPGAVQLRLHRAIAALRAEHLLDADDALRRLRGTIEQFARTPLAALYRLAQLMQSVRTGHYDDALSGADTLLDDLRPLGVEAGYGHGLLALCYRQTRVPAEGDDTVAGRREQAAIWWRRATTLLPAAALIERFPELAAMENEGA